ncbi:hypothetical protein CBM2589_A90409 [Cupriavidus taiwanensis]|uniref:Uncharacterized protein n=1 Tax=Cupriavidus taiwanensis TaxID=164546 RepID=A0A975XG26_9BURK|nr:hypothetical protein CBM2589_A90409 [Cupriavidus taiwanensis]
MFFCRSDANCNAPVMARLKTGHPAALLPRMLAIGATPCALVSPVRSPARKHSSSMLHHPRDKLVSGLLSTISVAIP